MNDEEFAKVAEAFAEKVRMALIDFAFDFRELMQGRPPADLSKPPSTPPTKQAVNVDAPKFPPDLAALLTVTESKTFWHVQPIAFLGSENFVKIADAVRAQGGEYVSAGKASHFKIPKLTGGEKT